jgi:putative nucleotidyltransferase with HDIG domain
VKVFSGFAGSGCPRFSVSRLAQHSILTGTLARKLAKAIDLPSQAVEDSFMAGLLHDVGKLLLVDALPTKYDEVIRKAETAGTSCWEAEQAVFGTSHAEVGTYLLWLWGMPDSVVEAIAYHHAPSQCPAQQSSPLTAVYMSNVLTHAHDGEGGPAEPPRFDPSYVQRLGLPENLRDWGAYAGEVLQKQETR